MKEFESLSILNHSECFVEALYMAKTPLQNIFNLLKSKFFPAKFYFSKIQKKILAGKNTLQK
jgi:hypothetical protein